MSQMCRQKQLWHEEQVDTFGAIQGMCGMLCDTKAICCAIFPKLFDVKSIQPEPGTQDRANVRLLPQA